MDSFTSEINKESVPSKVEIRRRLIVGREAMSKLAIIVKNDDVSLNPKIRIPEVNALVFTSGILWRRKMDTENP